MKQVLTLSATLAALFVLLFAAGEVHEGCREALRLCGELLIPSLFPFFVLAGLLGRLGLPYYLEKLGGRGLGKLWGVSGAGVSAFFVGLCGGYPLGAAYVLQLQEQGSVSRREAERLLAFCNNSGPAFLVSAVGLGAFGSARLGLLLYGVHVLAAFLCGLFFRSRSAAPSAPLPPPSMGFSAAFAQSVRQGVQSVLNLCGFVVVFTALAGLLEDWGLFHALASRLPGPGEAWWRALFIGFLELGSGAGALRGLGPTPENLALAAFLLGWGGVSVQFQAMALLADSEIKGTLLPAGRLVCAALGAALMYLFACLLA